MDDRYQMKQDGTELTRSDVNKLGEVSGLADDRLLADLLQWASGNAVPQKMILPYAAEPTAIGAGRFASLVVPTLVGNGGVYVYPFRAAIGSRTPEGSGDNLATHRDDRTGVWVATGSLIRDLIQFDATVGNHRIDLLYAKVELDQDQAAVTRYVKSATGSESPQAVSVQQNTLVSLEVVKGAEAASPTRPALPADADPIYYIPLAYVWHKHPFLVTDTILIRRIEEVAPILGQNHGRVSGLNAGPCKQAWEPDSALQSVWPYSVDWRPRPYMAPSMSGMVVRWLGVDLKSYAPKNNPDIPVSTAVLVDDSIDWRFRQFKIHVQGRPGTAARSWGEGTAADGGRYPEDARKTAAVGAMSQYWSLGTSAEPTGAGSAYEILTLTQAEMACIAASAVVTIQIDTAGRLQIAQNATSADCCLFFWIEATGQMQLSGPQ